MGCDQGVTGTGGLALPSMPISMLLPEMSSSNLALDGQDRRPIAGSQAPIRVAVLDADTGFVQVLSKRLETSGYQHRLLASPVPLDALVAMRLNAVVLDLAVLGPAAWSYLEKLCARLPQLGVVVCTGQSSVAQRVRGLRLGADDWVTKPCHPEEVIARVEAVVRRRKRAEAREDRPPVIAGELEVRADQFQAFVAGVSADLTRREFELIQLMAGSEGQVLQREEIYERVWGYAMVHGDRSVDVFVRKLRQKLEKVSPGWRYIHTHFGVGYRFAPEPVEDSEGGSSPGSAAGSEPAAEASAAPAPATAQARAAEARVAGAVPAGAVPVPA
jgi:DNA-binding response OmpR family regulator